jgi:RHS repeat-associated protein
MKRTSACHVCLFLALFVLSGISVAQVATGTPLFGSFGGGPFDVVNLGSLDVHFAVPIRHKAGRETAFGHGDLTYDNSIWTPVTSGPTTSWQPAVGAGNWGWQGLTTTGVAWIQYSVVYNSGQCGVQGQQSFQQWNYSGFVYHDLTGTSHFFSLSDAYFQSPGGSGCPANGPQPPTPVPNSIDGYTLTVSPGPGTVSATLTDSQGNAISVPISATPPSGGSASFTDSNGNQITATNGVWTDTLGTTALTVAGSAPSNTTLSYTAPSGAAAAYTVHYVSYTVATAFASVCSTITDYSQSNVYLVDKITRPDGTFYQFTYEPTIIGSQNVTARIKQVTLPTGGTIQYTYGPINCADGTATSLTRTLSPGGTWNYSRLQTGTDSHWQTTITDPTAGQNQTTIDFQQFSNNFYETQRVGYQGAVSPNNALSTVITCYNTANPTPSTCPTTPVSVAITRRTVFRYVPDTTGVAAETDTQYLNGNPNLPIEVDSYDYGAKGNGVGPLIRKVLTANGSFNYGVGACLLQGISGSLPCTVTIQNSAGATVAKTTYSYDETTPTPTSGTPSHVSVSNPYRGNLTTLATQVSGTTTLYRKFTYYDTGTMKTSTDAGKTNTGGPNITTFNYTAPSCGNSFVTSINEPLSLSRSMAWDCNGGVMTSVTDENTKTATTFYTGTGNPLGAPDTAFWRPFGSQDQLSNGTKFTYPSATASESSMAFNSNNSVVDHRSKLDSFGRPIVSQTLQAYGGSTYDATETDYDVAGRVAKVTRPYSAATDALCTGTCPATTETYDALGRPSVVTDGGGGTITSTYSFNDVLQVVGPLTTGEHLKQKQLEYDGLGRLTSVCEITSVSGSGTCGQNSSPQPTGFWTKYTYDVLGNMTGVTQNAQPGSSGTQTRTYAFDMLGRLTSELNPETGSTAVTYIYDSWDASCGTYTSAGDLVEKKDAMNNVTCLKYDALHRTTDVTYPSGTYASVTAAKHYVYDSATVNGTAMSNAKGRMAEAYTGTSGSKTTDLGFSYSARGEVADVWESTLNSGGYYHVNATYWANGKLNVLNGGTNPLPGLPAITYGVNSEGRASIVSAATGQNPVTATSYNVAHQVTGITFGSADSDAYTYDPNTGRMTQYKFNMGTGPQTDIGTLTWNANGTLGQLQITDQINTANSQTCTFGHDDLVRITSANCGAVWAQTFGLDPFGNLSKSGSAQFLPTYTSAPPTNRYASIPGGSVTYDSNGNLTNDVTHTYTWDADGNNLSVDGSTVTVIYDALDRMIEQTRGSAHTQIVYGPYGMKLALMNGQTFVNAFVKLPGGARAVYSSTGLAYYRHSDHLGTSRLATTTTRTKYYDVAYAPYGEDYNGSGTTPDLAFTDQNQDTAKNGWSSNLYDFMLREYRTAHGRWTSPDPAGLGAVDPSSPQSWNRYAYVVNNPLAMIDILGDDGCYDRHTGAAIGTNNSAICAAFGGDWRIDPGLQSGQTSISNGILVLTAVTSASGGPGLNGGTFQANTIDGELIYLQLPAAGPGMCTGPTCSAVHAAQAAGEKIAAVENAALKWYLCGTSPANGMKAYTLEGTGKGLILGAIFGSEIGPEGTLGGAAGGAIEGFFSGAYVGVVAAQVCQAAGVYGPH